MNIAKIFIIIALLSIINLTYSQDTPVNIQYNDKKLSVAENGCKSLFIPGWGNPKRKWVYRGIEIGGISCLGVTFLRLLSGDVEDDGFISLGVFILSAYTLGANHLISSIDAMVTTSKYNERLKQKYKLSLSPTYNPQNNGIGIGFAVNF